MNKKIPVSAMKFFCSFLVSAFVLFVGTKNALILADYNINKAYYERVCENKDKPIMACHGKCQAQKNSQKEDSLLSLHQFNLELFPIGTVVNLLEINQFSLFSELDKISDFSALILPEISLSIPVPPPVV